MDSLAAHNDYGDAALDEGSLDADPFAQFRRWLAEAESAGLEEPNAMVVGTVDPDGVPSSRTVLLRGVDDRGFAFYSNYGSRKGLALATNPSASLLFPWYPVHRQVIVQGAVTRLSAEESDAYFASRPRGSRLAAIASDQSQPIASRAELERRVEQLTAELTAEDGTERAAERPAHWGGYVVDPHRIEFWKGRTSRLHDRLVYTRTADTVTGWTVTRLQP
ncbi:pyridoxamine 5'-phosphate oxidase [Subtercola boreus]|uniref:Pyridoxine/pyridoxamine 5'-phosphate oxidase n=1 Tax=Subtercola boreus TaxID=120213 RepID=A0A3E0WB84_9MICO|nr:pyridoxamine 5'-phosphate oxidase [Subtercola boreus]RFA20268.1 pyridoxamine 5'-phosphate oxidase [Subtercola boreus]RFA20420.1 pyridoxamine 5'-phosphate oxidase [Subtercola boreus]RFA26672.1 pyridoxamine 5'-phosphate oxidase [Subtercola boreus]